MEPTKISGSQNGPTNQTSRAKSSTQQQGVSDAGNETAASGFLALLAAMGDASGDGAALAASDTAAMPADLMTDATAGTVDASAVAAWHGLFGVAPNDGALGAAASAGTLGTALGGLALDGRSQGLVAETMKLDTSADLRDGPVPGASAGFSRSFSRLQGGAAQRVGGGGVMDAAKTLGGVGELAQRGSGGQPASAAMASAMHERVPAGVQPGTVAAERAGGVLAVPMAAESSGALAAGAVAALSSSQGAGSSGGNREGESHAGAHAGAEVSSASSTPETANVDGVQTFSDVNPMGAEEQVADQVTYWVNQKTQSAEMTLNRDGQPVEVSVSLSGNEAHVSFRSDQAETRALLDQSMAQLSDLLRGEGLVLSGMSVGTSAQGDGGSNGGSGQPGSREGARQAQVVSKVPAGSSSLLRGSVASDRAVDIFV